MHSPATDQLYTPGNHSAGYQSVGGCHSDEVTTEESVGQNIQTKPAHWATTGPHTDFKFASI